MIERNQVRRRERRAIRFGDAAHFFRTWTEKPLQLGSVTPSSRTLSRVIASYVDARSEGPVIEIGAGTGPVTEALLRRGVRENRLILLEYSDAFCTLLERRFPKATVLRGDALGHLSALEATLGRKVAALVCGIPLLTKPESVRLDLLRHGLRLLQPQAPFIQFTYSVLSPMPLKNAFFSWEASPRIWRNVPPARVWVYREPLRN